MRFPILRLQVQREPLKTGRAPMRTYDPTPIESVPRLEAGPSGVRGIGRRGELVLDVHNVDHPRSRDRRGLAGVTVMGTGDYAALRSRFGDHLTEGVAGETILLDAPQGLAGRTLPETITVHTAAGPIDIHSVRVAEPCVEFTRFCLMLPSTPDVSDAVLETLRDLGNGERGYRGVVSESALIALGDEVEIDLGG